MLQVVEDKKIINKILNKLNKYVTEFEKAGVPFEKIFNCERVKHNCFDNNFFCFKEKGQNHTTYRMLYRFIRKDENDYTIEPHMTILKRQSAKFGNHDYMPVFAKYAREFTQV